MHTKLSTEDDSKGDSKDLGSNHLTRVVSVLESKGFPDFLP